MSVLTLIRHAQASFFDSNYDKLSPLGEQQARTLGTYWARQGTRFDLAYCGPKIRQQRSAELTVGVCREMGRACPEPVVLKELDEYDLHGLVSHLIPELSRSNVQFAQELERYLRSEGEERLERFRPMFEPVLHHWQSMNTDDGHIESWPAFRARVESVIRRLQETNGQGLRLAVFTSSGFIGSATQFALAAPDRAALELHFRLRNTSLTEFVFTRDRFSLETFNAVPHLDDPGLWTYL